MTQPVLLDRMIAALAVVDDDEIHDRGCRQVAYWRVGIDWRGVSHAEMTSLDQQALDAERMRRASTS